MSAEQTTSFVQRTARSAREAQAARRMSLARALRLTAAKQADRLMGLPLSALGITQRIITSEDVPKQLAPGSLMILLDGKGDQVAAAVLDPVLVTGLIQQQTMGKVMPAPDGGETRRHTATDAALCAPFIEGLLARGAMLPDEPEDCALMLGYRFGVWAKEPRQAELALDASDYVCVEMTLDLAAGVRVGKLNLLLPKQKQVEPISDGAIDTAPEASPKKTLAKNVMGLKAELMIALARLKLPLNQVSSFKVGDTLELDLSSMAHALIIDRNGRAISRGTLGQIDGMRAVQLEQTKGHRHTEPRRRASDREALDLPDVSAPHVERRGLEEVDLPELSDMDVFGDLGALPDLPDMDEAAEAADSQMAEWKTAQEPRTGEKPEEAPRQSQSVW